MDVEAKHRQLDAQIREEQKRVTPDELRIATLKKQKLILRDQFAH